MSITTNLRLFLIKRIFCFLEQPSTCQNPSSDRTEFKVTNFISDYFTTEEHLLDSLSLIGPTATNIAVTPMMQFYGGGVYDNSEAGWPWNQMREVYKSFTRFWCIRLQSLTLQWLGYQPIILLWPILEKCNSLTTSKASVGMWENLEI